MKKRIITALTLILMLVIALTFGSLFTIYKDSAKLNGLALAGGIIFFIIILVTGLIAITEYLNMRLKADNYHKTVIYPLVLVSFFYMMLAPFFPSFSFSQYTVHYNALVFRPVDFLVLVIFWLFLGLFIGRLNFSNVIFIIFGLLFLSFFFRSLIFITLNTSLGAAVLWYLLSVCAATDTFALLFGKWFGKKQIAPKISPNKTWVGSICGTISGIIIGVFFAMLFVYIFKINTLFFGVPDYNTFLKKNIYFYIFCFFLLSFLISLFAQAGDLIFSLIKREHNIKDFSNLLPGHGGILDRIDSYIFAIGLFSIIYVICSWTVA